MDEYTDTIQNGTVIYLQAMKVTDIEVNAAQSVTQL
jgi:hypothetical protein